MQLIVGIKRSTAYLIIFMYSIPQLIIIINKDVCPNILMDMIN